MRCLGAVSIMARNEAMLLFQTEAEYTTAHLHSMTPFKLRLEKRNNMTYFKSIIVLDSTGGFIYDPMGSPQHAYAVKNGSTWSAQNLTAFHNAGYPLHFQNMEYHEGNLYMNSDQSANSNQYPTMWKSTNGGSTWQSIYELPNISYSPGFGLLKSYNGKFYTDHSTFNQSKYTTNGGSSWVNGPLLKGTYSQPGSSGVIQVSGTPKTFNGSMVGASGRYSPTTGLKRTHPYYSIRDTAYSGAYLYVLTNHFISVAPYITHKIYQTKDFITWQYVDTPPVNTVSIEVAGTTIYAGTDVGTIYKSDKTLPAPSIAFIPSVLLLLDD